MLKRLYVHNYKCLVNFEINFDQDVSLFLGANGSGKSTVFEVLTKLHQLVVDEEKIENIFDESHLSRWLERTTDSYIHFELDIENEGFFYKYFLKIDTMFGTSIIKESLHKKNDLILEYNIGDEKEKTFLNYFRSNLRYDSSCLNFINYLRTLFIAKINPYQIISTINKSNQKIKLDFSNFAEWFSYLNEKNRKQLFEFEKEIRSILSGFDYFRIEQAGQAKLLQVDFENKENKKEVVTYNFHELSEGQKVLIAIYTLIYCTPDNSIICIDEPENFLALPEIQPWLNAMRDQCSERNLQVILISHHPSLINFLASSSGYWFSRQDNHTRIEKITQKDENGLSLAQLIEMGWIYGD